MNDESLVDVRNVIAQIRYGLQFLYEEFKVEPVTSFQIDPFGSNSWMASDENMQGSNRCEVKDVT